MRWFLWLLTMICGTNPAFAQAPLGPRLGDEISRAERDYFGLFPRLGPAFESARVVPREDGVGVVVARTGLQDTTLVLDPRAAAEIGRFAETFEHTPSAFLNPHWQEASGGGAQGTRLDASVPVLYLNPSETTVLTVTGQRLEGVVLVATDSLLLLHPSRPYQWAAPPVARLRPSDIHLVQIGRRERERVGPLVTVAGGLLGVAAAAIDVFALDAGSLRALPSGVAAATLGWVGASFLAPGPPPAGAYDARLGALQSRAVFQTRVPLDFRPVDAPPSAFARGTAPASRGARRWADWRRAYGWVNVSILGGASGRYQASSTYTEFVRNQLPNPTRTTDAAFTTAEPEIGVDVAFRPVPFVRLGGTWMRSRTVAPLLSRETEGTVTPGTVRGYAEAVIPTPRRQGVGLDLSLGAGLESVETALAGTTYSGTPSHTVAQSSRRTGLFYQGTLDLVLPQRSSLFVRLTSRSLPSLDVPGAEVFSTQFPDILLYRLEPFTTSFGTYREVTWGTRFRF